MILVTGATGTVGSEVVEQLLAAGHPVRVLTRHPEKAARYASRVEIAQGDLAAFSGWRVSTSSRDRKSVV